MMKYISFLAFFLLFYIGFSQCEVDQQQSVMIADPPGSYSCQVLNGNLIVDQNLFDTDSMDRIAFPNAIENQLYESIIGVRIPNDTTFTYDLGNGPQEFENVVINSLAINSVEGLPMGFSFECVGGVQGADSLGTCAWAGGDYGCIKFFSDEVPSGLAGGSSQAYPLNVLLDVDAVYSAFGLPIPITLTVDDLLNYYVLVISEEELSSSSGIIDARNFSIIGAFPNPTKNHFTLQYGNDISEEVNIKVYDILGNIIIAKNHYSSYGYNEIVFDSSKLTSGIYTIGLSNASESFMEQIIVK